ncbi:helix-turn-helix domain-containing protein [Kribbella solani]|uniref:TrmB family transcriptional regulator n=1 Tax=Kribbella solani TaxID=236067 RepID=UPI0029A181CC|nr:helix-turn-helix domain-containing protein [Kribbella solani]MDX2969729.1 helix-turn-helix domain-containing protein [Kribbella solani]MDX3001720.1 helix-turn-helix domain-containing protein [Kribbella solani]
MLERLVEVGLDPREAQFYLAVLDAGRMTIADAARSARTSRTNGYDLAKRLRERGLISMVESGPTSSTGNRSHGVLVANDPARFLDEWAERRRQLESLVPELRALHASGRSRPRVRYLEGASGIRSALFETLEWKSPILGILSMRDLLTVPGEEAMRQYIAARRTRELSLRVIRTREHDVPGAWLTSSHDFREVRFAPARYAFTMTTVLGESQVVTMSSARERFAMIIESHEYAELQRNLFEVLWTTSTPARVAD